MSESRLPVLLTAPDGSRWRYADQIGRVSGLTLDWTYPGGPSSAEFSLDAPAGVQSSALAVGSKVYVYRGPSVAWRGRVATIDRGSPWRIQCDGLAGLATREPVATTGSLDAIVDDAISGGLPWSRPASLSTRTWSAGDGSRDVAKTMLDEVLSKTLLTDGGKRWTVSVAGVVSAVTDPTTPAYLVRATTVPPLTLNDYATRVIARYQSSTGSYSTVKVTNAAAEARFGRVVQHIDFGYLVLTSSTATAYAQAYLDRVSPRMTVAGDFTVSSGQVRTASGAPADLPLVRPGQVARIQLVSLVRDAMVVPTTSVDMLIGRTHYDADSHELTLSPVERARSPLQEMWFGRYGGKRTD